jgi:cytochrome c-type biogenesis protein CcmH/NrfF
MDITYLFLLPLLVLLLAGWIVLASAIERRRNRVPEWQQWVNDKDFHW